MRKNKTVFMVAVLAIALMLGCSSKASQTDIAGTSTVTVKTTEASSTEFTTSVELTEAATEPEVTTEVESTEADTEATTEAMVEVPTEATTEIAKADPTTEATTKAPKAEPATEAPEVTPIPTVEPKKAEPTTAAIVQLSTKKETPEPTKAPVPAMAVAPKNESSDSETISYKSYDELVAMTDEEWDAYLVNVNVNAMPAEIHNEFMMAKATRAMFDSMEEEPEEEEKDWEAYYAETKKYVLQYVNEARAEVGVQSIVFDEYAQKFADIRVEQITQNFTHMDPDGSGIRGGEVIMHAPITNEDPKKTASSIVGIFKSSLTHWTNLMGPTNEYGAVGVLYYEGEFYCSINYGEYVDDLGREYNLNVHRAYFYDDEYLEDWHAAYGYED